VKAHLSQSRGNWAEGSCEPERLIVAGENVVVFVHVRVRLKHNTEWHEGRLADVYTFRNGRAIQMHAFADRRQALEWAGVKASDEN
jgi:ketosteroid isomerase-like protein